MPVSPRRLLAAHRATIATFAALAAAYLALLALAVAGVLDRTAGDFYYVVDDAYIHLAIADNLVTDGTWGVSPGVYESSSSSPAWTLLLAGAMVVVPGPDLALPLLLNVAAALWLLWQLASVWAAPPRRIPGLVLGGVVTVVATGLVYLTLVGMEHVLHAAALVAVIRCHMLAWGLPVLHRRRLVLYAALAFAAAVRFETLFVAAGLAVAEIVMPPLNVARARTDVGRRLGRAVALGAAAAAPVLAFGVVNLANDQYLLPNSVTAKSDVGSGGLLSFVEPLDESDTLLEIADAMVHDPQLLMLLGVVAAVVVATYRRPERRRPAELALLVAAALHFVFALVGIWDRYQAYLVIAAVALLVARTADAGSDLDGRRLTAALLGALLIVSPARIHLHSMLANASEEISLQQAQIAAFVEEAVPDDRAVVLNDLGYVAWKHDGPVVDLVGLGTVEVIRARKARELDREFVRQLVERADPAAIVIYAEWFERVIPKTWVPLERWCLPRLPQSVAQPCVTWYAPDEESAPDLHRALDRYDRTRPADLVVDRIREPPPG